MEFRNELINSKYIFAVTVTHFIPNKKFDEQNEHVIEISLLFLLTAYLYDKHTYTDCRRTSTCCKFVWIAQCVQMKKKKKTQKTNLKTVISFNQFHFVK